MAVVPKFVLDYYNYDNYRLQSEGNATAYQYNADQKNSYAHAYSSAFLAYDYSTNEARLLGNLRESLATGSYYTGQGGDERADTYRDLYNNEIGRRIGEYAKENNLSRQDVERLVRDAVDSGKTLDSLNDARIPSMWDTPVPLPGSSPPGTFGGWPGQFDPNSVPYTPPPSVPPTPPAPIPPAPPSHLPPGPPANNPPSGSPPGGGSPGSDPSTMDPFMPPAWLPPPGQDPVTNPPVSPLVLDLDGDGLDLITMASSHAYFDLDANGFAERTAWIGGDDGFLALDLNGNGRIDDLSELFGAVDPSTAQSLNGFTALAALDNNTDGVIDASDQAFGDLVVWRDGDGDGLTDGGELQSLTTAGVTGINLGASYVDNWYGENWVSHEASFTTTIGSGTIADIWFETDTLYSIHRYGEQPLQYDTAVLLLPDLKGYGVLPDLRAAMQERVDLRAAVSDLIGQAGTLSQAQFLAAIKAVLH
ncbi:MAG: hypothetical protein ABL908_12095, partial [Hyphomicrobium sp.]